MNRLALLLALSLFVPLAAHADDASHRAKAEEMVTLLHTDRMVNQVSANITKQVTEAAEKTAGPTPTPDAKTKLTDFEKKATDMIETQVGWKALQPSFVDIYAKNFTDAELDSIIAFYKSPAGVAFLTKSPEVNAQANDLAKSKIIELQTELRAAFDDFRKSEAPPAAAPPSLSNPK
jgi:hypothetical protein